MPQGHKLPHTHASAYPGEQIMVTQGANLGDGLSVSRDLCLGDAYEIRATALPVPVQLRSQNDPRSRSGDMILDCNLTLKSDTGFPVSAELYASLDTQGCVRKTHLRTDSLLAPRTAYYLIDINR